MTEEFAQYKEVKSKLSPVLNNLPGKLIAIDGKNYSGKTTLGRYLAWKFNVSLIETDLFRKPSKNDLEYYEQEIKRIIEYRLNTPLPVIIEGVAIQSLLEQLEAKADYIIYIINEAYDRDDWLVSILKEYEEKYNPISTSDHTIKLNVI